MPAARHHTAAGPAARPLALRPGAGRAAGVRRPAAAVQQGVSGGREHPGLPRRGPGGAHEQAWRILTADNPFAAIHGRVCYHPCEASCNRASLDSAVSIHAVERFLGDLALEHGWQFDRPGRSGRRVLVIGAGPSGLSAACHLARLGHEVEIRDAGDEPGGMMRYGIPAYRLPRDVLAGEVERLPRLGVSSLPTIASPTWRPSAGRAASTPRSSRSARTCQSASTSPRWTPGRWSTRSSYLRGVASGERPVIGRRVAVYGGGNTAMDAARTARRLGAEEAIIVYRRTREQMPAHEEEAEDAEREGVRMNWLRTIKAFEGEQLQVEVMELDETGLAAGHRTVRDAGGRRRDPGARPGHRHLASCATVPGIEFERDGTVKVSNALMTGAPGVFAGGDMVPVGADGHDRGRARQARRAGDRRVAARRAVRARSEASAGAVRDPQRVVLRRCAAPPAARA